MDIDRAKSSEGKKEQKKKSILIAAISEFSEKGYDKTVLDDVASKAGVAKGTVYLYYKDKKDLFGQTILFVVDNLIELIENIENSKMEPVKKIESLIRDQVSYFINNRNLFNLFQMAFQENLILSNVDLLKRLIERKKRIIDLLKNIVNEAKNANAIKLAYSTDDIIAVIDGVVTSILKSIRADEIGKKYSIDNGHGYSGVDKRLDSVISIIFYGLLQQPGKN